MTIVPKDQRDINKRAYEARKFLSPEEKAEMDLLLWSPAKAVIHYRNNPDDFVREVLRADPTFYQSNVLKKLQRHKRVCVRSLHGAGKTTLSAWAVLWFIATRDECKVPTTASAWRQLTDFLWPEISKWAGKAEWWRVGLQVRPGKELLGQKLSLGPNRFAFALASTDEAKIEGAHAASLMYVFDEAKAIDPAIWDAAEGALGSGDTYALAVSTPGDSAGRFYDIQMRKPGYEDWKVIAIGLDDVIKEGRTTKAWAEQRKLAWGENSVLYRRRVLGQFAEDEAETVITLSNVERAQNRWRELEAQVKEFVDGGMSEEEAVLLVWGELQTLGVDPAGQGADKTGFAWRYARGIRSINRTAREELMETAGRVKQVLDSSAARAFIDANGLGAGVYSRLKEQDMMVTPVQVGSRTKLRDRTKQMFFFQYRDWLWWNLRETLEGKDDEQFALPPNDDLTADLVTPKYAYMSTGAIKVEDKDNIRKRLGRSPDVGDACCLACAPEELPYKPLIGFV